MMNKHHDESNTASFEEQITINRDEQGRIVAVQELLMAQDAFEALAEHSDADVSFPIPRLLFGANTEGNLIDGYDAPAH